MDTRKSNRSVSLLRGSSMARFYCLAVAGEKATALQMVGCEHVQNVDKELLFIQTASWETTREDGRGTGTFPHAGQDCIPKSGLGTQPLRIILCRMTLHTSFWVKVWKTFEIEMAKRKAASKGTIHHL